MCGPEERERAVRVAGAAAGELAFEIDVAIVERRAVTARAARLPDVAVKLDDALAPGRDMEAVDVLGREQEAIAELVLERGEGAMARVRLAGGHVGAALRVEAPDERRVLREAVERSDVLEAVRPPEPARIAERRDPALGRDAGAGQDEHERVIVEVEAIGRRRHDELGVGRAFCHSPARFQLVATV